MKSVRILIFADPKVSDVQKQAKFDVTRECFESEVVPKVAYRNRAAINQLNCWEPNVDIIYVKDEEIIRVYEAKNESLAERGFATTEIRSFPEVAEEKAPEKKKEEAPKKPVERTREVIQAEYDKAFSEAQKAVEKASSLKQEAAKEKATAKALELDAAAKVLLKELDSLDA